MTLEADGGEGGKEEVWPVDRGGRGGKELMKEEKKKTDTCTHARHLLSSVYALRALCKTTGGRRDCTDVCVLVSKLLFSESRKLNENWANCTE